MFSKLFNSKPAETLWEQCAEILREQVGQNVSIQEIDRLAVLASHEATGDFREEIREAVADAINGFMDRLPF